MSVLQISEIKKWIYDNTSHKWLILHLHILLSQCQNVFFSMWEPIYVKVFYWKHPMITFLHFNYGNRHIFSSRQFRLLITLHQSHLSIKCIITAFIMYANLLRSSFNLIACKKDVLIFTLETITSIDKEREKKHIFRPEDKKWNPARFVHYFLSSPVCGLTAKQDIC